MSAASTSGGGLTFVPARYFRGVAPLRQRVVGLAEPHSVLTSRSPATSDCLGWNAAIRSRFMRAERVFRAMLAPRSGAVATHPRAEHRRQSINSILETPPLQQPRLPRRAECRERIASCRQPRFKRMARWVE